MQLFKVYQSATEPKVYVRVAENLLPVDGTRVLVRAEFQGGQKLDTTTEKDESKFASGASSLVKSCVTGVRQTDALNMIFRTT